MRSLEQCREQWRDHQLQQAIKAEHDCNGNLIRPAQRDRFRRVYGTGLAALGRLFRQPQSARLKYASPELVRWWDSHGHTTFEQWGWMAGYRHKFLIQAQARRWR